MFQGAGRREIVVLPLLLDMNQRPLTSAKREMLKAGESQPVILRILRLCMHAMPLSSTIHAMGSPAYAIRKPEIVKDNDMMPLR